MSNGYFNKDQQEAMARPAPVVRVPEFALTEEEGAAAYEEVRADLAFGRRVGLDLSGCHVLCTHWLSGFYGPLFDHYTPATAADLVRIVNSSPTNQQAIDLLYSAVLQWVAAQRKE